MPSDDQTTQPTAAAEPAAASEPAGSVEGRQGRRGHTGWVLGVCCVAQFMVILDLSIVNVALPHIQSALTFTAPQLLWVVDAYMIMFAGFLILGGRAADHLGQRKVFVAALTLFAVASLVGGLAQDRQMLVGARAVQGFAGAFMAACSLAIITSTFQSGPKLHRAIGLWAAMNGAGGAAGVLLGGVLTEFLTWRWVLLINPPIGLACAVVAFLVIGERKRVKSGKSFDLAGALTLTVGQLVLVFGVVEAGLAGWSAPIAWGPIVAGIVLLVAFNLIEARAASPLVPVTELTKPLRVANGIVVLFSAALFPMWLLSSLYLQQVLGLSPLHTGLIFLPMTAVIFFVASRAGKLVGMFGARTVLCCGLAMLTAGLALLTRVGPSGSPIIYVMIPGLLAAAGIAMSIVPSTIAATQGAKEGQAGLASGLVNTSRQVGGGLGLALLITLATQHSTSLIASRHGELESLTDGFRLAYLIGAALAGAAGVMAFALIPKPARTTGRALRSLPIAVATAVVGFIAADVALAGSHGPPIGAYSLKGTYSFFTEPSLHPPKVVPNGTTATASLATGYILTTSFYDLNEAPMVGQSGPLILDNHLQPVWFAPVPKDVVAVNLSRQTYQGKPVLAWWQGVVTKNGATESGEDVIVNQHYQVVARVHGANGWKITLHELRIVGDNAWVTANKDIPRNLSAYGGAYNGAMTDAAVQEYNLKTGALEYSWDALQHIPLTQSYATVPTNGFPWDAYHVNAIDVAANGTFLVSMRNTWAAYLVNITTGKIEWTLGGRNSSFRFGAGAEFQWQHDVAFGPRSTVTMFDDHCCQLTGGGTSVPATAPSRGIILRLDTSTHTATLDSQYTAGGAFESEYMGDTQPLHNGNVFIGWGSERWFSEYSRSGKLLLEGEFPRPDQSYRTIVAEWVGLPLTRPTAVARATKSASGGPATTVYASWNGATQVASWRLLGRSSARTMTVVARAPRSGFQTAIPVDHAYPVYEVQALDSSGHPIGTSAPFSGAPVA
jgi:EmrB/QacA subfamily drug resistance transporter